MPTRTFLSRLLSLFRRRTLEDRLDEEVRFHLEMEAETNRRRGVSDEEAAYAARRAFGGQESSKELYRDQRGLPMLEMLFKDIQYGFRMIARNPGFTLIAVLSLALGIGANTAIFTLIDAVLLRSLPVRAPQELVAIGDVGNPGSVATGDVSTSLFSYPFYQRLRDQNHVFSQLAATGRGGRLDASIDGGAEELVRGRLVSDNYFTLLGLEPSRGRLFQPGDDLKPGSNPAIVMSFAFWEQRFSRDPSIVGKTIKINRSPFTVIGVGPRGYLGEVVGGAADVWIPLSMQAQVNPGHDRLTHHDVNWLLLLGRRKPGVSIERARAEVTTLAIGTKLEFEGGASLSSDRVREIRALKVSVESGAKGFSGVRDRFEKPLMTLMFLVGLVLLIACANVANLLLARATTRQKEISVRLALGASRMRLVRQLLTESILLALMGGCAGLLLAFAASGILLELASNGPKPIPLDVSPDRMMLAFTAGVSLLTGIIFGLAPALRSTRVDLAPSLKDGSRGSMGAGRWQVGKLLVIAQVALSLLLLIGAGLFIRSLVHLETLDVGYTRSNLVVLNVDPFGSGYRVEGQLPMTRQIIDRLQSLPGVTGVTVSVNGVFSGTDIGSDSISVPGFTPASKQDLSGNLDGAGPHYFRVMGVPLLAGRDFDEHDTLGAPPVAIINETMAHFYFGNRSPIGQTLINGKDRLTIVGVAKDTKQQELRGKTERRYYAPFFQAKDRIPDFYFEIRTRDDAAQLLPAIRNEIRAFDPNLKLFDLSTARTLIDQSISDDRLIAQLSGFFGALALLLAATGLYGIMAYTISRRTNEIGLRMALGAGQSELIWMVLLETFVLVGAGILIGVPAALGASRFVESSLAGLSGTDPLTIASAIVVLVIAAFAAAWIPARRAARIDPLVALRQD